MVPIKLLQRRVPALQYFQMGFAAEDQQVFHGLLRLFRNGVLDCGRLKLVILKLALVIVQLQIQTCSEDLL